MGTHAVDDRSTADVLSSLLYPPRSYPPTLSPSKALKCLGISRKGASCKNGRNMERVQKLIKDISRYTKFTYEQEFLQKVDHLIDALYCHCHTEIPYARYKKLIIDFATTPDNNVASTVVTEIETHEIPEEDIINDELLLEQVDDNTTDMPIAASSPGHGSMISFVTVSEADTFITTPNGTPMSQRDAQIDPFDDRPKTSYPVRNMPPEFGNAQEKDGPAFKENAEETEPNDEHIGEELDFEENAEETDPNDKHIGDELDFEENTEEAKPSISDAIAPFVADISVMKRTNTSKQGPMPLVRAIQHCWGTNDRKVGIVYIFRHNNDKNLIKIGFTTKDDNVQHNHLSNCSAIYTTPIWESKAAFVGAYRVKQIVTSQLIENNVENVDCGSKKCKGRHKEWFRYDPEGAKSVIVLWTRFVSCGQYYDPTTGNLSHLGKAFVKKNFSSTLEELSQDIGRGEVIGASRDTALVMSLPPGKVIANRQEVGKLYCFSKKGDQDVNCIDNPTSTTAVTASENGYLATIQSTQLCGQDDTGSSKLLQEEDLDALESELKETIRSFPRKAFKVAVHCMEQKVRKITDAVKGGYGRIRRASKPHGETLSEDAELCS